MLCRYFQTPFQEGLIKLIKLYQLVHGVFIVPKCRFIPSCSEYTVQALQKYGLIQGLKSSFDRYKRCTPPNYGIDNP